MNKHTDNRPPDPLDRAIDTALARYASVEARAGLEQRILANLSAHSPQAESRVWWRWGFVSALAIGLLVAALAWRSNRSSPVLVTHSPIVDTGRKIAGGHTPPAPEPSRANRTSGVQRVQKQRRVTRDNRILQAAAPKRDQFPSPQPLSEQEKLLASYVAHDPHHAVLIARAQAELERQDHEEEIRETNATQDSKQIQQ